MTRVLSLRLAQLILTIFLALGAAFAPSAYAATNCGTELGGTVTKFDISTIRALETRVMAEVQSCEAGACIRWPKSFAQKFGYFERENALTSSKRLEKDIHQTLQTLFARLDFSLPSRDSLQTLVAVERGELIQGQQFNPNQKDFTTKVRKLDELWEKMKGRLNLEPFKLAPNVHYASQFRERLKALHEKYDGNKKDPNEPDLIDHEILVGSGYLNLGAALMINTTGNIHKVTRALDALTLLHPLTDNAIDKGIKVGGAMEKISKFLENGSRDTSIETRFEGLVLDLVHDIFEVYPRAEHPLLVEVLSELHKTQLASGKIQRDPNTNPEDLMRVILKKGGYTGLALSYIIQGHLNPKEAEFYYRSGTIFQLGDDLVDLHDDISTGTRTLWTESLKSKKDFRRVFQAFLDLQSGLEKLVQGIQPENVRVGLEQDIDIGFKIFMISAYLNPTIEKYMVEFMKEKIPLSPANVRSMLFNSYRTISEAKNLDEKVLAAIQLYGQVMDHHFLGNQYKGWAQKQNGPTRAFSIRSLNPVLFFSKMENSLFKWMANRSSNTLVTVFLGLGVSELFFINYGKPPDLTQTLETFWQLNGVVSATSAIWLYRSASYGQNVRGPFWAWVTSYLFYLGWASSIYF